MADYERRLDRLEERFGVPGCTCRGTGPGLQIVRQGEAPEVEAHCPIHKRERLGHVVVISGPRASCVDVCTHAAQRGATALPDGRVDARLPGPVGAPRG